MISTGVTYPIAAEIIYNNRILNYQGNMWYSILIGQNYRLVYKLLILFPFHFKMTLDEI